MPARIVDTHAKTIGSRRCVLPDDELSIANHLGFEFAPRVIELIQRARERARLTRVIGEQTADTNRHVLEPTCRIQPGTEREPQVLLRQSRECLLRDLRKRPDARAAATCPHAGNTLVHENTVVMIERNDVRDGAKRHQILMQFLFESLLLCLLGGLVGLTLGYGIGLAASAAIPNFPQAVVPMWAVLLSFGFSAMVGLVFGIMPAAKAANLDPIEALRYE